ncbi:MAG: CoA pyrophosphatase [Rhodocyclales bacterium]|nr:CoA pyrophosphatase [Rhodocyclales bacterium]
MRVDADRLREVFRDRGHVERTPRDEALKLLPAAVLVPLVVHPHGLNVLLTRRTDHLHHHPGQISFPGGRVEAGDTSRVVTALRETEEEIGLVPEQVELLGHLPDYLTGTGFCVTPVIGLVHPPLELQLDTFEVAEVFEVPLDFLMNPDNHKVHSMEYQGRMREYHAMPYGDYYIWGATAGILVSLYGSLRG